jgi:hypothetical protein
MIPRRRWHRAAFAAAGIYNLAWGTMSSIDPQWYFRAAGMPPINYPEIFACLGMVIGIYGLLYLEVARRPERGFALAAVGLLGKVLGPIGALVLVAKGTWPPRFLWHIVANDLVWWLPFALYLRDSWTHLRSQRESLGASPERSFAGVEAPGPSGERRDEG